ncbi:MAG: O-antigen ligase family protein, partial [Leptospiraceae bacterium]|nr:O-antigen ligase family protein [Leptospiraceae bacterium]
DGFKVLPGVRLQHLAGRTFGIVTYLPLGLMNTHLTYGGLLSLFLPGIGFYSLHSIYKNFRQSKFSYIFFLLLLLVPALFVFFYNQSRSAWLGLVFSVCFTLISIRTLRIFLFKPIVLFSFISLLVLGIFSASILIEKNWMLKRAFQQLNKKNSTENQRYFIYRFSLKIVQNSPLLGAGPGRFRIEHEMASQEMVKKQEQLWYESSITPRGHAHHDILHSQASGGILASFLLFLFWYQLFSGLIYSRFNSYLLLFSGILSLYVAGFFQCYFQDDEVLLPFLTFTGFYLASIKSRKTHFSFPLLLILFLLLFSSVGLILYRNIPSPSEVYERKIFTGTQEEKEAYGKSLKGLTAKLPSSKAKSGFRLEGCLNQRFGNPILPRKEDYSIALTIPKNAANPPQSVRVQAWERDAFDQDKEYKAHELRHLKDYYFELHTGRNILTFPGLLSAEGSVAFPENVYFRDFTFLFQVNESEPIFSIPQIDPGELCNAK